MKGQQGMSQTWQSQQSGYNDMQMWQRQLMYRQLQELQKQQQLQQLDQEAWQDSSTDQLPSISRQASLNQLPPLVNGMPIGNVPNSAWQNEHLGYDSRMSTNSQMFFAGNTNWMQHVGSLGTTGSQRFPNGLLISQDHGQLLQSTGVTPQQHDESLYGMPVSSNRSFKHYSQIASGHSSDMAAKTFGGQVGKLPMHSGGFNSLQNDQFLLQGQFGAQEGAFNQSFPGKTPFDLLPARNLSNGVVPENIHHPTSFGRTMQARELRGAREQMVLPGSSREKTIPQLGPAPGMVKLDPTEEKILFSTDDDTPWNAPFGSGDSGGLHRNLLEGNNCFSAYPSLQSGSWSALMQSAVAETSSGDIGLQDKPSGLSFPQKEVSIGNHPSMLIDSGKQQATWVENLQSASSLTSRPFPLFDETDVSSNVKTAPLSQQSSFRTYDLVDDGFSHQSIQQLPKNANALLEKDQLHNQLLDGNIQAQVHPGVTSSDAWAGQFYEQSSKVTAAQASLNQQSAQCTWYEEQNMPLIRSGAQSCNKLNGWGNNKSSEGAIIRVHDHGTIARQNQINSAAGIMHLQNNLDGNMWITDDCQRSALLPHSVSEHHSGMGGIGSPKLQSGDPHMGSYSALNPNNSKASQEENQQLLSNCGKHMVVDSSLNRDEFVRKYQYEANNVPHAWEQSSTSGKTADDAYITKRDNIKRGLSDGQLVDSHGFDKEKDFLLAGCDSHLSLNGDPRLLGHTDQKYSGSRRFQFHSLGNLGFGTESDSMKHNLYPQLHPQMTPYMLKTPEPGYAGQSQFSGQFLSDSARDTDNQHLFQSQKNAKGLETMHYRGTVFSHDPNVPASYDESATVFAQSRSVQTSQNMLELLHKVDNSRDSGAMSGSGFHSHNTLSDRPVLGVSDLQHPSALHGVGLHLALPSQTSPRSPNQSVLARAVSAEAFPANNSRHFDLEVEEEKSKTCPTSSVCTLLPMHGCQRENFPHMSNLSDSGQTHKGTSQLNVQVKSTPMLASTIPSARHDLEPQQQISDASGHLVRDQLVNITCGSHHDLRMHNKETLDMRQASDLQIGDMHNEAIAKPSGQPALSGVAGQVSPFSLGSLDAHLPARSQPYPSNMCQPHFIASTESYPRTSGQFSGQGAPSVSQSSSLSQQGAFQAMLQNMWTSVSSQQQFSGNLPSKTMPSISPTVSSGVLDLTTSIYQVADDGGRKRVQNAASCSINSQQVSQDEDQTGEGNSVQPVPHDKVEICSHASAVLQVPEVLSKHPSVANSSPTISSLVQLHQQDVGVLKREQGLPLERTGHAPLLNVASSTRDIGSSVHGLKSFGVQHPNYSLLQQVQAMKATEADPSKWLGKRPKGSESGIATQQTTGKTPQTYIYGYNTVIRVPSDKENLTTNQSPFLSDTKMLCFSSETSVDQNAVKPSQVIGRDVQTLFLTGTRPGDMQNHPHSLSVTSTSSSMGGAPSWIDPQMAPSWFGQHGSSQKEQALSMYSGVSGPLRTAKDAAEQYFFPKASDNADLPSAAEKRNDVFQIESFWQSNSIPTASNDRSSLLYTSPEAVSHNVIIRPKKRKTATSDLLPWRKEIIQGSARQQSNSMAELNWGRAANRLIEKIEDETSISDDRHFLPRARRRLMLTTKLMQQLLPAVPRKILSADATVQYESMIYVVAKLALGDACSEVSCSRTGSSSERKTLISDMLTSERDQFYTKVAEDFIERANKLEIELTRFSKRILMAEARVECQDLERFSTINRFAKFHGRGQAEGIDALSASDLVPRKIVPQRYVTALPMPASLPEGVFCLSL